MRAIALVTTIIVLAAAAAPPADAQIPGRVRERVRQKAEERRRQSEAHLVERAAQPVDSALDRAMSPADSVAARAGEAAAAAVGRVGRGGRQGQLEARLRQQLSTGRADLAGLAFEPGSDAITARSGSVIRALARVLASEPGAFVLQARADSGMGDAEARALADLRSAALKRRVVAAGVPGDRIFAAGDGTVSPDGTYASVLRVQ